GRQADDGLDHIVIYKALADQFLLATAKQHTVGHDSRHVVEQVFPLLVRDLGSAFDSVEINVVLEYSGKGVVFLFDSGDCLIEHIPDIVLEIFQRRNEVAILIDPGLMPTGAHRHKKGLSVGGLVFQQFLDKLRLIFQMREVFLAQLLPLLVELIRQPLQKKHAENEFLELQGIHLAAKNIG